MRASTQERTHTQNTHQTLFSFLNYFPVHQDGDMMLTPRCHVCKNDNKIHHHLGLYDSQCACVNPQKCLGLSIHTQKHTHTHTNIHTHTQTHTHTHTYTHTHTRTHTHTHMDKHTHTNTYMDRNSYTFLLASIPISLTVGKDSVIVPSARLMPCASLLQMCPVPTSCASILCQPAADVSCARLLPAR